MAEPPKREIKSPADMKKWLNSKAYHDYLRFVTVMNNATKGLNARSPIFVGDNVNKVIALLNKLDALIDETPPVKQPARFGNSAYRTWFDKMSAQKEQLLKEIFPEALHSKVIELSSYLVDSFGNRTRIDYGTGHEMNFAIFLMCLFKLDYFSIESDAAAVVCKIFDRYMKFVRRLQTEYRMEPAGSHGAWSLDDFQFLPFLWGSAQLIVDKPSEQGIDDIAVPCQFLNENMPEKYEQDYLFMACIAYINRVKHGPFFEHSNQLYNASGTPSWQRLNEGFIRMYKAEVLAKFPVIQHVVFGELVSIQSET